MASQEVWNLTEIFFRYMSPINYIILYDPRSKTISRNKKHQLWFYFQLVLPILSELDLVNYVLVNKSDYINNSKALKAVAYIFLILYAGIVGLFSVSTISVGFCGDTFYNCFNTVIKTQRQMQGKSVFFSIMSR